MAAKTLGEKVDDLSQLVATLKERIDNVREDVKDVEDQFSKFQVEEAEKKSRLVVIEERLGEIKKGIEESSRRIWSFLPPLLAALVASCLTILFQRFFPP